MLTSDDATAVNRLYDAYRKIADELANVIVGQNQVVEELLITLFSGGHCLLVGVPGLAKTLIVRTLAECLDLNFNRIQFTPDLMPADITGTEVIQENREAGTREFRFLPGPIFGNMILADEINRTPPKTQAALLEAMQEHQVTVGGNRHPLSEPFFVLATQNPIEQEGTYPLPEAQLDRFMLNIVVDYPDEEEELQIVMQTTSDTNPTVSSVLSVKEIIELGRIVRRIPVAEHVARYALRLARLTRRGHQSVPSFIEQYVSWGAGPRASQYLILAAKARSALHGRNSAGIEDVRAIASPVLRHRILTNFNAEAEGVDSDEIVRRLISHVDSEADKNSHGRGQPNIFRSESPS